MATQTEEVKAGRELDILMAERVFGMNRLMARVDPMNRDGEPQFHWGYPVGHDFAPYYSESANEAMQIVEKLKAEDFWPSMTWKSGVIPSEWDKAVWFVRFRCVRGGTRGDHWDYDESLPLAICKAALKVREENPA